MLQLRQNTAATRLIGPILTTAGVPYTTAVIGELNITKNGTTAAMAAAATLTHSHNGNYLLGFIAGNVDTLGECQISLNKAGSTHRMDIHNFTVVTAVVYDAMILGTDNLQIDMIQIDGLATNGNNATLFLKQLNLNNNAGNALLALSTGGNGHGIAATGQGAGHGISATGGATGNGFRPSGVIGINASGSAGAGILGAGTGANPGARFTAGLTGNGVDIVGGGTSGHGINISTTDGNGIFGTIAGAAKFLVNGTIALIGNITGLVTGNAVAGDAMTLTAGERTATANVLEAAILNEGDATALLAAIAAKVEAFLINEGDANATLAAIAAAVRTNLATELARIDVVLSTRLPTSGYTAPSSLAAILAGISGDHGAGLYTRNTEPDNASILATNNRVLLALPAFAPGSTQGVATTNSILVGITGEHGAGSYQTASVIPGAIAQTFFINHLGVAIPDADVWVTSDAAGNIPVAGTFQSDSAGNVTALLDSGVTYYLWMQKDGFNPILGLPFVATAG